jgi:AbiV family abortive infection protein
MRTRATAELGSLSDAEFFDRIADGMNRCIRNGASLLRDARRLGRGDRLRSSSVMLAFGHEEIAKYLILLDAVRCPRTNQKGRSLQLKRFNEHLAKDLYVELYDGSPATFGEVRERADSERAKFFLDGPSDVDWIFRNTIIARREQSIYVDFVVSDEGSRWESPDPQNSGVCGVLHYRSHAHQVALALHAAGLSNPKALAVVAKVWRELSFLDETRWGDTEAANYETLKSLEEEGLLRTTGELVVSSIIDKWFFPLYGLDLSERHVSLDELRERQAAWGPDW